MLSGAYWSPFGLRTSRTNMHRAQLSSSAVQCSGSSFSGRNPRGPPNRPAIGDPLAAAAFSICAFFCSTQCLYAFTPYVNLRTKLASAGWAGGCGGTFTGITWLWHKGNRKVILISASPSHSSCDLWIDTYLHLLTLCWQWTADTVQLYGPVISHILRYTATTLPAVRPISNHIAQWQEAHVCDQLAQGCNLVVKWQGAKPVSTWSWV